MVAASALGLLFSWTGVLVVLLSIIHVIVCIFLLAVVLLQRGRTGDVMSAFGGPTPSSYAALSTDDLLTRMTKIGAATFMVTSLSLALLASRTETSVIGDDEDALPAASAPADAAPADATPAPAEAAPAVPAPAEGAAPDAAPGETAPSESAETAPSESAAPAPSESAAPADAAPAGATTPATP